ncbi:MAG TPA: hypothetical protein VL098_10485 [Flavipsychrobacter sp.]|nr:hypothetical protein [Flavipsychrobacter sp.]
MKYLLILAALSASLSARAQIVKSTTDSAGKNHQSIEIELGSEEEKDSSNKKWDIYVGILDIGINSLKDKTDYASAEAQSLLQVPSDLKNENLFSLKVAKSVNVNIYPILLKYRMVKTKSQRLYASVGLGLQIYNFRFSKPISYQNETTPQIVMDSVLFSKNKIAITYLSVPLMLTSKTRMSKDLWLVYGVGVTGGFRVNSLQKQISDERGKQKNRDQFNFNNFNACVTGEIGIDGYVRLFGSYQLTNLYESGLQQHPYTIGVRFLGI